jgi:hypothetical protein
MKWKAYAVVVIVAAITVACGSNSSDKETTTLVDTSMNVPDTTDLTTTDTLTTTPDPTANVTVKVPAKTKESFEKKYPQAKNVKWVDPKAEKDENDADMDESEHKVWFHWQGSEHQNSYDKDGNLIATKNEVPDPSSIPVAVTNAIKREYSGYTVKSVTRDDHKGRIAYEIKLEKGDEKIKTLIGENGTVIKKKVL